MDRAEQILQATRDIIEDDIEGDLTNIGKPTTKALEKDLECDVTAEERDEAYATMMAEHETGDGQGDEKKASKNKQGKKKNGALPRTFATKQEEFENALQASWNEGTNPPIASEKHHPDVHCKGINPQCPRCDKDQPSFDQQWQLRDSGTGKPV